MEVTQTQLDLIVSYGVFAVLFVSLLVWVLKKNGEREENYQSTIDKLADLLHKDFESLKTDVKDIKDIVLRKGD
jgi:hypothetical protein